MDSAYFDSSVFLAIFNKEPTGTAIKALLKELKRDKVRIYTSIITIQEVSVLSFRRGTLVTDHYAKVDKLARIEGITKEIALTAAKLEAQIKDLGQASDTKEQQEENRRRKWDCFHLATALSLQCKTFYALDPKLLKRREQLSITSMEFCRPEPKKPSLDFPDTGSLPN